MKRALVMLLTFAIIGVLFWTAQAYLSSGSWRQPPTSAAAPTAAGQLAEAPTAAAPTAEGPLAMAPAAAAPVKPTQAATGAPESAPSAQGGTPAAPQLPAAAAAVSSVTQPVPVADAAEKVRPAVAFIAVRQVSIGTFQQPVPQSGVGSGVIFDQQGHILTNNHVIEDAQDIRVTLPDGRTFQAKLVGADQRTDLAVIQINGQNLPTAPLGDSDKLRIGEWVVAIGNALGLEGGPTVTAGVVGALNRSLTEPNGENLENLIQTDAAINPGNSGGPLINLSGQVVGINTAIATDAQGIGFAISISAARPIFENLLTYGRVIRPYLGIQTVDVTPALANRYDLPVTQGLLVISVEQGSPADRAGLQQGDVVTAIDSEQVKDIRGLRVQLDKHKPGDTVQLTVMRNGKQATASVTLAESPS